MSRRLRVGTGVDAHRFGPGRPLMLGTIHVDHAVGLVGHSDGDVIAHAVCDAILAAAGEPDIGVLFPPSREWEGASGARMLGVVVERVSAVGFRDRQRPRGGPVREPPPCAAPRRHGGGHVADRRGARDGPREHDRREWAPSAGARASPATRSPWLRSDERRRGHGGAPALDHRQAEGAVARGRRRHRGHLRVRPDGLRAAIHIGNARPFVVFSVLKRFLARRGLRVTLVSNLTDVNDKIYDAAAAEGVPSDELARRYAGAYIADTDRLGLGRPDVEPLVTESIPEIVALIATLVERGLAYAAGGDVYYRVDRFPGYGKLSGRRLEDAGEVTAGGKGNDDPHRLLRPNLRPCRLASDNGGDHDERREKHFLRAHDCVPVRSLYLRLRHLSARLDCKARAITGTLRAPRAARKPEERVRAVWRRGQASLAPLLSRQAASRTRADQVR